MVCTNVPSISKSPHQKKPCGFDKSEPGSWCYTGGSVHHSPLTHPFGLVACKPTAISVQSLRDRNLGQVDILHHRPDNSQTTGLSGERVNLIGALSDIAKETLDGIG